MAVISVTATDTGEIADQWSVPGGAILANTSVPRGLLRFNGTTAIAALLAADQTRIQITLNFQAPYAYILRNVNVMIGLDSGTTNDFEQSGTFQYSLATTSTSQPAFELRNDGLMFETTTMKPRRHYRLLGDNVGPKLWIDGDRDDIKLVFADVSADATVAGDIFWNADFWMYDNEQKNQFPVNSPDPVIAF